MLEFGSLGVQTMKKIIRSHFVLVVTLGTLLCVEPALAKKEGPVQVSPDTYVIFREDHAGIFGSLARLKSKVIREANEFAAKQGKIAIPISVHEKPLGNGPAQWASFEYQFRVVSKDDPEARRTTMTRSPDLVVESKASLSAVVEIKDESENTKDLYGELLKLDELRQKNILSESEFQSEKAKLLSQPVTIGPKTEGGASDDLYGKLLKLDELRTKGILTEAEFETQKKKVLDSQ